MARPEGMNHFCDFLKGFETQYVIIGGGAAAVLLELQGLTFRATKDIDLVILTNTSDELNKRILQYLQDGKYKVREATEIEPRYYRFSKPESAEYPAVIELFARNEQKLEIGEHQHIVPIHKDANAQLSAILLDEEYFSLIQNNIVTTEVGKIPFINGIANICLKARAHREMTYRLDRGDTKVDKKDIRKHLKDILKIAQTLTGEERQGLGPSARNDLVEALSNLDRMPPKEFKDAMKEYPGAKLGVTLQIIRTVYSV